MFVSLSFGSCTPYVLIFVAQQKNSIICYAKRAGGHTHTVEAIKLFLGHIKFSAVYINTYRKNKRKSEKIERVEENNNKNCFCL